MQFRLLALLSLSAVVSASVVGRHGGRPANPQPSATSPWYSCPDNNTSSRSKVSGQCDSPPHKGTLFGCTYNTGKGTGTHACTYNSKTGECVGGDANKCPKMATITRSHKKRSHLQDETSF